MIQITQIYKDLKSQNNHLAGIETQVQALLDTNVKNLQNQDCLQIRNRDGYFDNQHRVFNALFESVIDLKIATSYSLLDIEAQLREEVKK
ncbi:hypothetical protein KAR91_09430 [Candidatus Pacearchaeota archaeon]|nr:hypothetical protein [Candidatus Pacearchaeota archaeon]